MASRWVFVYSTKEKWIGVNSVQISLRSHAQKYEASYELKVKNATTQTEKEVKKDFNEFFDEAGYLVPEPLEKWLDEAVLSVGGLIKEQKSK